MASSQRTVVRALCVCARPSVFKLHAYYTACDNGGHTVQGASAALWCVSFLRHTHLLITHSPVSTCSFIICLGQQTLVTQREVNVKQTVYLLHCWQPSALFARCIRHSWWTALAELHPFGYSWGIWQTWDLISNIERPCITTTSWTLNFCLFFSNGQAEKREY